MAGSDTAIRRLSADTVDLRGGVHFRPKDLGAPAKTAAGEDWAIRVPPRSGLATFAAQFANLPVALLAGSAVLSLATGGVFDAAIAIETRSRPAGAPISPGLPIWRRARPCGRSSSPAGSRIV